jgi:hypothetical protein
LAGRAEQVRLAIRPGDILGSEVPPAVRGELGHGALEHHRGVGVRIAALSVLGIS